MGATLSTESVLTTVILAGAVGVGYHQYTTNPSNAAGSAESSSITKQQSKKKKKKGSEEKDKTGPSQSQPPPLPLTGISSSTSSTIPGQFDDSFNSKPKKSKKKKPQHSTTDPSATTPQPPTKPLSPTSTIPKPTTSVDTDGSWTRVEARRKAGKGDEQSTIDVITTSDAGITSSVTENSSPVDEESTDKLTTLAEKLVPRPPKTDVDDMLPDSGPTLARVMRVKPLPNEKPPPGFSWRDYDNVHVPDGTDADGEDDDGEWGVVMSKRPRPTKQEGQPLVAPPSAMTKKQRQNAKKREAQKAASAAAEAERVVTLAKHKRELERIRIMEQSRSSKKGKASGGMSSVVDNRGKLVWE
ncbi:hypothetical protein D9756_002847 [Leucocoprinus leucothites]|uniref:Uncharacterized protein n=1 Tax=Leucocoprinus leucothites TaxID=201217 RepID=A0A8H5LLU7_9AGAR|nr:hypothetical protein D9756_002847 [Leucoagaricus leucothites]